MGGLGDAEGAGAGAAVDVGDLPDPDTGDLPDAEPVSRFVPLERRWAVLFFKKSSRMYVDK